MAGLVAVALAAGSGCTDDDETASAAVVTTATVETTATADTTAPPQTSPSTIAPASEFGAIPAGDGPIEPGNYLVPSSAWSVADFTVTFPGAWSVQYGHVYNKHSDTEDDEFGFYAAVVDEIYTDACAGSTSPIRTDIGPTVDDLVTALLEQPGPDASDPVETTLGGYPAVRIDLTVPADFDFTDCNLYENGIVGLQVWHNRPTDKYFVLVPDSVASVYILDVAGERQVFLTGHRSTTSDEDIAEMQAILDSILIES